ncbi:MAG: glycoside hydrolase family 9 protein [Clostridiales bacterium]|nr:glycoside hydrolase family 9 protein [Clostridiales bacterium]
MKDKVRLAALCGIFLAVAILIGGVVIVWKKTFDKKASDSSDGASASVEASTDEADNSSDRNGEGDSVSSDSKEQTESTNSESADAAVSESDATDPSASESASEETSNATGKTPETTKASDSTAKTSETTAEPSDEKTSAPKDPKSYGTISGNGREGIAGTGKYNYGEALQKSLLFYELQRSGDLPENTRCNWRGDSCLHDGSDVGLDLTGGWFDAGDNVKFNLPMAYTAAMLGWSVYEDFDAYKESKQLTYALDNIRWANEYFIKCHPQDELYYYQVGNGSSDHSWWGPGECVEYQMSRPSYFVDAQHPGSAVTAETAASLAVCSILFKDVDPSFSTTCLDHAKSLYAFADKYKSDEGYTAANGFYDSWSGYYDELCWAGVWLYRATGDKAYLDKAKEYYPKANQDYNWALCWDDVHIGAAVLLAQETGDKTYTSAVEKHLDYWTTGTSSGDRITYTPKGLAWLDSWGSLRYATTTAFVAAVYSESDVCSSGKKDTYWNFAVAQAGYALGDTGFSYQIGFGDSYPHNPHHRTAQGSYCDNMNDPSPARHILCGALVGGPDASDGYTDVVSNYNTNEVACDYNAGFTGLMAKLYTRYHGQTLKDFGAGETVGEEYRVDTSVNAGGSDFLEIKAITYNMTGWPARAPKNLELRYYFSIPSGKALSDLSVSSSYGQNVKSVTLADAGNGKGCVQVLFEEYSCYPGGQEEYKKEVQFRITGLPQDASGEAKAALYEDGALVFGEEPDGTKAVTPSTPSGDDTKPSQTTAPTTAPAPSGNEKLTVTVEYTMSGTGNAIAANMTIENTGSDDVALTGLVIEYYFTNEKGVQLSYDCYHSAINRKDGQYEAITSVKGDFAGVDPAKDGADTLCTMSGFGSATLRAGDKMVVQFSIHHNDWSDFNLSDDYSRKSTDSIVIAAGDTVIFGKRP